MIRSLRRGTPLWLSAWTLCGLIGMALAWRVRPSWGALLESSPSLPSPDWSRPPTWSRDPAAPSLWGYRSPARIALPPAPGLRAPDLLLYAAPGPASAQAQALPEAAVLLGTRGDFELPRELGPGFASLWLYSLAHARTLAAYDLDPAHTPQ